MKSPHLSLLSLLTCATLSGCIWSVPAPETGETLMRGNCGELTCEELLNQLRNNWSKRMIEYEASCQGDKTLGFNVYEKNNSRKVSLICWGKPAEDGVTYGDWLGTLPFPGDEANFVSQWNCLDSPECEDTLSKLRSSDSETITAYETECAVKDGELRLLISEESATKADVKCVFFVPSNQIDDNGDGISDGEAGKPTGVDEILGQVDLPE